MALSRETLLCLSFILLLRLCGETVSESSLEVFLCGPLLFGRIN